MTINNRNPQLITLNIEQAARALGLSRSTVFKFINSGELPSFIMGGRRLVEHADVLKLIASHKSKQDSRADFRADRARRGVDVRSKRRTSPVGVNTSKDERAA